MNCTRISVSSSDEICVADSGISPLLCFSTKCLGHPQKAERSRLVLCILPASHLESSSTSMLYQTKNWSHFHLIFVSDEPFQDHSVLFKAFLQTKEEWLISSLQNTFWALETAFPLSLSPISYVLALTFQTHKAVWLFLFYFLFHLFSWMPDRGLLRVEQAMMSGNGAL